MALKLMERVLQFKGTMETHNQEENTCCEQELANITYMEFRDPRTARIGVDILPFEVGYLPEYFKRKAEMEMNDTHETRKQYIRELKDMIRSGGDKLREIDFAEDFLLQHLRTRKFKVARAFKAVESFVNLTNEFPLMFKSFDFSKTVRGIRDKITTWLPYRCQDGCAIFFVQLGNWSTEDFPMEELRRLLVVMLMQAVLDPMTQVNGFKVIIDIKGFNLSHVKETGVINLILLYNATQLCCPGRYKGVHMLNSNKVFRGVWQVLKHILSRKLIDRIHFHSSTDELFDFFPKSIIPLQYGGELQHYDQTEWLKKMMSPEQLALIGGGALNPI